nr:MAG TPA: hypothetical protein [Caudoviricetes sp.]
MFPRILFVLQDHIKSLLIFTDILFLTVFVI